MATQPRSCPIVQYKIRPKVWSDHNLGDALRQIAEGSEYWSDDDKAALIREAADRLTLAASRGGVAWILQRAEDAR